MQIISPAQSISRFAYQHALRQWKGMSALAVIMVVEVLLGVLAPWPMKWLVDSVLGSAPLPGWITAICGDSKTNALSFCVLATIGLFGAGAMLGLWQTYVSIGVGQRLTYSVSTDLFAHLQRLSLRFHSRKSVGDSIRRVVSDCGCVTTIVRDCSLPIVASVLSLLAMIAISLQLSWQLTLAATLVMPLMLPLFLRFAGPIADRAYEYAEAESQAYEVIERSLSTIPIVQAFGREAANDAGLRHIYDGTVAAAVRSNTAQMKLRIQTGLLTAIGTSVILYLGAQQVLSNQLTVGSLLVFLSYIASIYSPIESIVDSSQHILDAAGSARRVLEIFALDEDVVESPDARRLSITHGSGCDVRLENVSFGYEPGRMVLRDLSLHVAAGQIMALVGTSGAGKTTLLSLLPRLYDVSNGQILIDSQDLRSLKLRSLREQIGIVLQQPFLFPISIAENIAYGRPDATREQVENAARDAAIHDFIATLPDGYETIVGERGSTLSVGQRQRISIARALLKDPPLLLLDEPTSALDAETESSFVTALQRVSKHRTTLVIAHRLSTVRAADRIAVLSSGKIIATGTHDDLMRSCQHYAELCHHQLASGVRA